MNKEEMIMKAKKNRESNSKKLYEAIGKCLSHEWKFYTQFQTDVRKYVNRDLEYSDINDAFEKWEKNESITEVKGTKGKKSVITTPVEWKDTHSDFTMIRLKSNYKPKIEVVNKPNAKALAERLFNKAK